MANIITGNHGSIGALPPSPTSDEPHPHWNTATTAP